jgi:hypothetical protein
MTDDPRQTDPAARDESLAVEESPLATDATSGDQALRAAAPGWRQDPDSQGPFVVDDEGTVVDTGSPQDYGEPNDEVSGSA